MVSIDEQTKQWTQIKQEEIRLYRYIGTAGATGTKRHIRVIKGSGSNVKIEGLAEMYEDVLEETTE